MALPTDLHNAAVMIKSHTDLSDKTDGVIQQMLVGGIVIPVAIRLKDVYNIQI